MFHQVLSEYINRASFSRYICRNAEVNKHRGFIMVNMHPIYDHFFRERQLSRILLAIRKREVFLYPPLASFMLGQKKWSLKPIELAILSLLSEYGKPVVAEQLNMSIDTLEDHIEAIHEKLENVKRLTDCLRN